MFYAPSLIGQTDGGAYWRSSLFSNNFKQKPDTPSSAATASLPRNGTSLRISTQRHFHKTNDADC